jgi:hypothetical protein
MSKSRKFNVAAKSLDEVVDSFLSFVAELDRREADKVRQRIEEERAGRTEKRAERRLGIAERNEARDIAGVEREAEKEAGITRKTSDLLASPTTQTVVSKHREIKGVDAGNIATQTLGTARTAQEASGMVNALELDTYNAIQLLGEQRKEETKKTERDEWLAQLKEVSPVAAQRMEALDHDMDVKTAAATFPFPEEEVEDKAFTDWLRKQAIKLLTTYDPESKATWTKETIIKKLKLSPELQMEVFGGEDFDVPNIESASLGTAAISSKPQTDLSAETQPAPIEEEYNPADHIPAGDTMPVAGEEGLSPEEQTEHDLIKKAVAQGTKFTTEDFRAKLTERGFAPDSIERILSGL